MRADQLHVITAISNPILWASRIRLYADFEQHMLDSGVRLTTVECTYGEHEPQIAANPHVNYVRVRASGIHKVWIKECLLNLGISATADAKYIATVDADVRFRSRDWARDTVHALQHFHIIQPWAYAYDLGQRRAHQRRPLLLQPLLPERGGGHSSGGQRQAQGVLPIRAYRLRRPTRARRWNGRAA